MEFKVDGGCRGNGYSNATGACAAVLIGRRGNALTTWTRGLRRHPTPTNQRAEISTIILALEQALDIYDDLNSYPYLELTIMSDSRYAVDCMEKWIYKWSKNGWTNAAGREVANRDLIEEASDLDDRVKELGKVTYMWIPRHENEKADGAVNKCLDGMHDTDDSDDSDDFY